MSEPIYNQDLFWTPRNLPDGSDITEIHISGSTEIMEYLFEIIDKVKSPFDCCEDEDSLILTYTSVEDSINVFDMLYETLSVLHSELTGKTDGLYVSDDILYFKKCLVWIENK